MITHLFDKDPNAIVVPAHQAVFREGDAGEQMYAVVRGEIEIVINGQVVETVGPGGIFGEMALIEDRPRNATAQAKSESAVVSVDKRRFLFLVQQNPFFALHVMAVLAERLRRMDAKL